MEWISIEESLPADSVEVAWAEEITDPNGQSRVRYTIAPLWISGGIISNDGAGWTHWCPLPPFAPVSTGLAPEEGK